MQWTHPAAEMVFGFPGYYLTWLIMISGLSAFCLILFKRYRLIKQGKPDPRFHDFGKRVSGLVKDGLFQRRQPRYPLTGVLHIIIFWGFVILGLHSIDLLFGGLGPGHGLPIMNGMFGALYNTLKDVFVLLVLAACLIAIYRRAVIKPKRYQGSNQLEAYVVLGLIAFLMLTDMFYEGSRLLSGNSASGFLVAAQVTQWVLSGVGPESLITTNHLSYWLHLLGFFFFLTILPLSKHFHIITGLPNVFFKSLHPGTLKPPQWGMGDIEQLDEAGLRTFKDFTWKHILDFFSCTECGRCTDHCPANAVGKPLSPKTISMQLRDFGYQNSSFFRKKNLESQVIPGEVVLDEAFWACTTCGACERECPVFIEHIDKIIELRRRRVLMESKFPSEIAPVYRNMETYGDSWGAGSALRNDWARGLGIKTVQTHPDIDLLYWVGCAGAFDSRSQQTSISLVKILQKAGIHFGILGPEEKCCGDYARRTGNEYLFQILAKKNIETFQKYHIRKILVACPHGYNTLKNEYPLLGGNFEVVHATEFILNLIEEGKLTPSKELSKRLVYHDPCYLGRHNGLYDIPRRVISSIGGANLIEAEKSKDKSFCCGAGGGHFWMESSGQRINNLRIEQLLEKSPDLIVTGCPYCQIMLEDGLESKEMKGQVLVKDIIEVVSQVI
jgi:Fe-S oxidoreductase